MRYIGIIRSKSLRSLILILYTPFFSNSRDNTAKMKWEARDLRVYEAWSTELFWHCLVAPCQAQSMFCHLFPGSHIRYNRLITWAPKLELNTWFLWSYLVLWPFHGSNHSLRVTIRDEGHWPWAFVFTDRNEGRSQSNGHQRLQDMQCRKLPMRSRALMASPLQNLSPLLEGVKASG